MLLTFALVAYISLVRIIRVHAEYTAAVVDDGEGFGRLHGSAGQLLSFILSPFLRQENNIGVVDAFNVSTTSVEGV